jgi:hypothetical protein
MTVFIRSFPHHFTGGARYRDDADCGLSSTIGRTSVLSPIVDQWRTIQQSITGLVRKQLQPQQPASRLRTSALRVHAHLYSIPLAILHYTPCLCFACVQRNYRLYFVQPANVGFDLYFSYVCDGSVWLRDLSGRLCRGTDCLELPIHAVA